MILCESERVWILFDNLHSTWNKAFIFVYLCHLWNVLAGPGGSDHGIQLRWLVNMTMICCAFFRRGFVSFSYIITMTSQWARWRLKSPASRLFTQAFIQDADQRKHQSSASLAFVRGIHRWPMNSLHKGPVTRKMFPFDDVFMMGSTNQYSSSLLHWHCDNSMTAPCQWSNPGIYG